MIMTWIKFMTNGVSFLQRESTLIKILFKIPAIRIGVMLKTYKWFANGIE